MYEEVENKKIKDVYTLNEFLRPYGFSLRSSLGCIFIQ